MAYDDCHPQVVHALEKGGWRVDPKSFYLELDEIVVAPDIRAQYINGVAQQIIVVEVKCFSDEATTQDELYRAIGQYMIYRNVLKVKQHLFKLYLAVPKPVFDNLFKGEVVSATVQEAQIRFLVVDIEREEIIEWRD